jgi:DNA polymerase I-like protein with 3'-5' exonuclease and polymerase domains
MDAHKLLHDGALAFGQAERAGMRIDVEYCQRKKEFLTKKIKHLQAKLDDTKFIRHWKHYFGSKFNMYSNPQLSKFLYDVRKITPTRLTFTGKGSTDDQALMELNIPELNAILEIRKITKIRDTYLEAFIREQVDGFMHPFFNLHLVRTYRSSSDHPNFQNIPKRDEEAMRICRRAIIPRPGFQLLEADYSGIEVRISACYHKDSTMLDYISDPKSDMHLDMAKQIFMLETLRKSDLGYVLEMQQRMVGCFRNSMETTIRTVLYIWLVSGVNLRKADGILVKVSN